MNGFKSYLLFTGKSPFLTTVIMAAISAALIIAAGIIKATLPEISDLWDFVRMVGHIIWIADVMLFLRGVFSANQKSAPGYRFFHALPNASANFKRALITADISLLIGTAIFAGADFLILGDFNPLFTGLSLFALGWINLFGNYGAFWINAIPFFLIGFSGGFLNATMDNDDDIPEVAVLVLCAVFTMLCVVGTAYVVINSRRLWEKEK